MEAANIAAATFGLSLIHIVHSKKIAKMQRLCALHCLHSTAAKLRGEIFHTLNGIRNKFLFNTPSCWLDCSCKIFFLHLYLKMTAAVVYAAGGVARARHMHEAVRLLQVRPGWPLANRLGWGH